MSEVARPETRYARVGEASIGYQVVGEGPLDLVYVTGLTSNIETMWEYPRYAAMLERMGSYSRLILFDRRGSGVSDPVMLADPPTWEHWADDLRAVLDATGSERAALLTDRDGAIWGVLFAATAPERTSALIVWNGFVRTLADQDFPEGESPKDHEAVLAVMEQMWGTTALCHLADPSMVSDPDFPPWTAKHMRSSLTPGAAARIMRYTGQLDARHVLPAVQAPTLVLHRRDIRVPPPPAWGRYIADHISGARFVEVPGEDSSPYGQASEFIQDQIEAFLGVAGVPVAAKRVLATVLFTDIVSSTERAEQLGDRRWRELLSEHDRIASQQVARSRGHLVKTTGDGILATFDGPGRAISCALALSAALMPIGITTRCGLHAGEIELREDGDIAGIAVHVSARVMAQAGPTQVVCSRTVRDLVAGSDLAFDDLGTRTLKGLTEGIQLYAVRAR